MNCPCRRTVVAWGRRLLAAGAFVLLGYLFAHNLRPWPRYEVRTGAKLDQEPFRMRGPTFWGTVRHLSNDGRLVTVGIHEGDFRGYNSRLELWDAGTGENRTPEHWKAADWQDLLTDGMNGTHSGLLDLSSSQSGWEFLHDEAAWAALRRRLANGRVGAVEDIRKTVRPIEPREEQGSPFPHSLRFSRGGRFITYVARNGWPVHLVSEAMGDETVLEETRTGRRIALPACISHPGVTSPDGRTAIAWIPCEGGPDERPRLAVWDLGSATFRAQLWFPDGVHRLMFTPDGRYVVAYSHFDAHLLRWWNAETGQQVGEIDTLSRPEFLDGGRLLVIASRDDQTLHFWETATGRALDDWELDPPRNGRIGGLAFPTDRFVVAHVDPDIEQPGSKSFPAMERVVDWMSRHLAEERTFDERRQILVLDAIDRRALGQVRGVAGSVSANGRWLATLDADGVARVWELPVGRPWARGFAYAAGVFVGAWGLGRLRRLRRRASGVA